MLYCTAIHPLADDIQLGIYLNILNIFVLFVFFVDQMIFLGLRFYMQTNKQFICRKSNSELGALILNSAVETVDRSFN